MNRSTLTPLTLLTVLFSGTLHAAEIKLLNGFYDPTHELYQDYSVRSFCEAIVLAR